MLSTTLRKQEAGRVGVRQIQEYGSTGQCSQRTECPSPSLGTAVSLVNIIIIFEQHFIQYLVFELTLSKPTKLGFRICDGKQPVRSRSKPKAPKAVGHKGTQSEQESPGLVR